MAQERAGSGWTGLKDKVKESIDKVVEVMGSYPAGAEDMAVAGISPLAPLSAKKKRARRAAVAKAARPARTRFRRGATARMHARKAAAGNSR